MGYSEEIIIATLLLCLGVILGMVVQTGIDQQEHVRMIKESVNFTENIPEKGYFYTNITILSLNHSEIATVKPPANYYYYNTNKGIEIKNYASEINIGTKYNIYGYKDSRGITIFGMEEI